MAENATRRDAGGQRCHPYATVQPPPPRVRLHAPNPPEEAAPSARQVLRELVDEVRKARQDINGVQQTQKGLCTAVQKLAGEMEQLAQQLIINNIQDKAFTVKGSEFQVDIQCTARVISHKN